MVGVIFAPKKVRLGHIPKLAGFAKVLQFLRIKVPLSRAIIGVIVCGSVSDGTYNLRSDLDVVIVYRSSMASEAHLFIRQLTNLAAKYYVPLELTLVRDEIIHTQMHFLTPGFFDHLRYAVKHNGLIGANPLPLAGEYPVTSDQNALIYIGRKNHKFENWDSHLFYNAEYDVQVLQEVLDAPVHVARRFIDLHESGKGLGPKSEIALVYRRFAGGLADTLDHILDASQAYVSELQAQQACVDIPHYRQALRDIKAVGPLAAEFIRRNIKLLST